VEVFFRCVLYTIKKKIYRNDMKIEMKRRNKFGHLAPLSDVGYMSETTQFLCEKNSMKFCIEIEIFQRH
jgi:hypothetical protein